MRIVVTETINDTVEVAENVTILVVSDFDTGAGKVPLDAFVDIGTILFGSGAGTFEVITPGDSDIGKVLTVQSDKRLAFNDVAGGVAEYATFQARLTLESGVSFSLTNQTAKTVLYLTPHIGNRVSLYNGSGWNRRILSEVSIKSTDTQTGVLTNGATSVTGLSDTTQFVVGMKVSGTGIAGGTTIAAIPTSTSITLSANATASGAQTLTFKLPADTNYDVFVIDVSGTPKLQFGPAWSSATARSSALALQDSIYVLSSDYTYRYCGSIRTTSTDGQMEKSTNNLFLWNYYNRIWDRVVQGESTSHSYATPNRLWMGSESSNKVGVLIGIQDKFQKYDIRFYARSTTNWTWFGLWRDGSEYLSGGISGFNTQAREIGLFESGLGYHKYNFYEGTSGATNTMSDMKFSIEVEC